MAQGGYYAVLEPGARNSLSPNSAVYVGSGSYLDLQGFDETIASLSGSGYVQSYVTGDTTVLSTLTIDENTCAVFSGVIRDGGPALHGQVAITLAGSGGLLILTGHNTNTGVTTINAGQLNGRRPERRLAGG